MILDARSSVDGAAFQLEKPEALRELRVRINRVDKHRDGHRHVMTEIKITDSDIGK